VTECLPAERSQIMGQAWIYILLTILLPFFYIMNFVNSLVTTQDSLAGNGLRIDWAGTNAHHQVLKLLIARVGLHRFPQGTDRGFLLFEISSPLSSLRRAKGNYCAHCANPTVKCVGGVLKHGRKPSISQ